MVGNVAVLIAILLFHVSSITHSLSSFKSQPDGDVVAQMTDRQAFLSPFSEYSFKRDRKTLAST